MYAAVEPMIAQQPNPHLLPRFPTTPPAPGPCPACRYQGMTAEEIQLDRYKKFRTLVSILRGSKD